MKLNKKKIYQPFLTFCLFCLSFSLNANEADINEIKQMLLQQNKILQQQQQTIEHFKTQNSKLRKILEQFQAVAEYSGKMIPKNTRVASSPSEVVNDQEYSNEEEYVKNNDWKFSITPRTALRFNTFHDFSNDQSYLETQEEPAFWTNGATVSVTSPWLPSTSFLFSALYGEGSGNATAIATQAVPGATIGVPIKMKYDADVVDFEILARTMIKDTNAYWLAGIQYVGFNFDYSITSGPPIFDGLSKRNQNFDIILGKLGVGGFFNLSDDGTHRIFSNAMLGFGYTFIDYSNLDNETWIGVGGDVNVGYQWIINKHVSISPRYRAQIIYQNTEDETLEDQTFLFHGPELHFSYQF